VALGELCALMTTEFTEFTEFTEDTEGLPFGVTRRIRESSLVPASPV